VILSNNVIVHEKVDSSGHITLFDGVNVSGKLSASGSVELRNGVFVGDKVDGKLPTCNVTTIVDILPVELQSSQLYTDSHKASGSVTIDGGELGCKIAGKISASGSVNIKGNVKVGEDIKTSGRVTLQQYGNGLLTIGGNIKTSGGVTVEGNVVFE